MGNNIKHASLFSGLGGFDLASEWMGWTNVFNCEIEPFPQKILKHYWPNAIQYDDIKQTDLRIHRGTIDVLTGGFPCQPYSQAGKRKGKEDDRHLWPEMLRAIREIQPTWVVGENVRGLLNWSGGLVFDEVQTDLEAEGYKVQAFILPACGVNAPHRRDRIWFVAKRDSIKRKQKIDQREKHIQKRDRIRNYYFTGSRKRITTNTKISSGKRQFKHRQRQGEFRRCDCKNATPNTDGGRQSCKEYGEEESGRIAEKSISNYWENFPTQSPVCSGDDGFPPKLDGVTFPKWRNESIKGYGNAVVPQVVHQIFKTIEQMSK